MQRVSFVSAPSNFLVQCFRNLDSKDLGLRDLGMQFRRSNNDSNTDNINNHITNNNNNKPVNSDTDDNHNNIDTSVNINGNTKRSVDHIHDTNNKRVFAQERKESQSNPGAPGSTYSGDVKTWLE